LEGGVSEKCLHSVLRKEEGRCENKELCYNKIGRLEMKLDFAKRHQEHWGYWCPQTTGIPEKRFEPERAAGTSKHKQGVLLL